MMMRRPTVNAGITLALRPRRQYQKFTQLIGSVQLLVIGIKSILIKLLRYAHEPYTA